MSRPKPKTPRTGVTPPAPITGEAPEKEKLSDYEKAIANRLRSVRVLCGVTSKWVSGETGISKPTISRLFNGQQRAYHEYVYKVCKALEVRVDFISDTSIEITRASIKADRETQRAIVAFQAQPHD